MNGTTQGNYYMFEMGIGMTVWLNERMRNDC